MKAASAQAGTKAGTGGPAVAVFGGRGGGALAALTLGRLAASGGPRCLGFLNDVEPAGSRISGYPVLGPFAAWRELPAATCFAAPLHKAKEMARRAEAIRSLRVPRERWAILIDPQAVLAPDAIHGVDLFAAPGATIMCGSRIGDHVTVRAGGHVSHDTTIEDFVLIGVNAVVCGYSKVREGAHIAPGALVREGITVGRYSVIGLGAVVVKDVPDGAVVAGNPARQVGSVLDDARPKSVGVRQARS